MLNSRLLAARKRPLYRPKLRQAQFSSKICIEQDFRTPGIDEERHRLTAIYPHADQRQRLGPQELQMRTSAVALHFIRCLALEALQLRDVQCRVTRDDHLVPRQID